MAKNETKPRSAKKKNTYSNKNEQKRKIKGKMR
jgi:hypothetical protein